MDSGIACDSYTEVGEDHSERFVKIRRKSIMDCKKKPDEGDTEDEGDKLAAAGKA